ncbi:MAG: putative porin [Bacteroidales bacterium]
MSANLLRILVAMSLAWAGISSSVLYAQEEALSISASGKRDSVRKARRAAMAKMRGQTYTFYDYYMQSGVPTLDSVVNDLHGFQIYDKAFTHQDFRLYRNGVGMTDEVLEYDPKKVSGFELRSNPFSSWNYTIENTPFYQTKTPYTTLFFANNFGKNLNYFTATHTQNVYRGLNLAIDFNVLDSKGAYINSSSNHINFRFYGNYFSRDGRYRLLFGYIRNVEKIGENGGIKTDSLFTDHIEKNRLRIPVNLPTATTRWRENNYFFKHSYHFYADKKDTLPENDKSYGFLVHTFEVKDMKMGYKDQTTLADGVYSTFYLNPQRSFDSTLYLRMTNRVFYSSADMERIAHRYQFKFAAGFKNEYIQWRDDILKKNWVQWFPFAQIQMDFADRVVLDLYADYGVGGYNNQDFNAYVDVKYLWKGSERSLSKRNGIDLMVGIRRAMPDWIQSHQFSNHFYWENALSPQTELYAHLNFDYKGWWFKLKAGYKDNYTYFKKEGPVQGQDKFWVANLLIGKNLRFGRYVGLDNLLMLSYSSNENYLHLPLFSLKESIYGIIPIKKLATIQVGLDFFYNTPYYADGYMPATASYYWQNEIKTGNALVVDLFVSFQIKRMNLFVKLQNMTEGMIAYNYMYTPHYPFYDRSVRFGLVWRFYD